MATGDQSDMFSRLKSLLPRGWFPDSTPLLDGLLWGYAQALAWLYSLYLFAKAQTRIKTATGGWLDMAAQDFFGTGLVRYSGQSDDSFKNRIIVNLFRERGTRNAMAKVLTDLTGRAPLIFEPSRPADTGSYGAAEVINFTSAPQIYKTTWNGNELQYQTARKNLIAYASDLTKWFIGGGYLALASNTGTAPDGTLTADQLTRSAGISGNYADSGASYNVGVGGNSGKAYTFSIWLNLISGPAGASLAISDLNYSTQIKAITLSAGWARYTFTSSGPSGAWNASGQYIGGGINFSAGSVVLAWGAQLEVGSSATPLINNNGTTPSVTDYTQDSNGLITFSSAPAAASAISWSGAGVGAITGSAISATMQQFATGDGATTLFPIRALSMTGQIAYGYAGGYGSLQMPFQAFITAYRPQSQGLPNIAGYGSPTGGYSQGSQADYASILQAQTVADADIYAAIEAVKPIGTQVWARISS